MVQLDTSNLFSGSALESIRREGERGRRAPYFKLLISDTGGGHRSCANALRDALLFQNPEVTVDIVDGLRATERFPLHRMPELYTRWSERRHLWRTTFYLSNGRRLSQALFYPWQKLTRAQFEQCILEGDPDMVVGMHPCLTAAAAAALRRTRARTRFSIVVTDLVYGHASWFSHGADTYFVPTEAMARRAVKQKIPLEKIHLTGLPLAPRLFGLRSRKEELRAELGFVRPTVVCVGGADGMGIQRLAPALADLPSRIDVHVICGKNTALRDHLTAAFPQMNLHVHGFVSNLPEMLAAADMALVKASPTVLMEAVTVGTYVLVYDFMPGQEYPNVRFVRDNELGDYSRSPRAIRRKILRYFSFGAEDVLRPLPTYLPPDGATVIAKRLLSEHGQ